MNAPKSFISIRSPASVRGFLLQSVKKFMPASEGIADLTLISAPVPRGGRKGPTPAVQAQIFQRLLSVMRVFRIDIENSPFSPIAIKRELLHFSAHEFGSESPADAQVRRRAR